MQKSAGPDFLCIGLQKGGTQWLYDQLQHHPDFWMPPFKELHYFDSKFPYTSLQKYANNFVKGKYVEKRRAKFGDKPIGEREAEFLRFVADFGDTALDLDTYDRLFTFKGAQMSGDITPGYSGLKSKKIEELSQRYPNTKVLMMLREPVSRLWSHWLMRATQTDVDPLDADKFKEFTTRGLAQSRSFPTKIAKRWQRHFGDRFRYFFLEDVVAAPEQARVELIKFLGAEPGDPIGFDPGFNRKAKTATPERPKAIRIVMREIFAKERKRCARMFGGPAEAWPKLPY